MDLEKSFPLAEAAIDAEQNAAHQTNPEEKRCLNCEAQLTDKYCPHCGQKDIPKRQTLGELLINFVSSFWSFESKFLRTGQYLVLKPGLLAKEYNAGKRERYYHPARMYVFISFIYFLLLTSLPDRESDNQPDNIPSDISYNGQGTSFAFDDNKYRSIAEYDSIQSSLSPEKRDGKVGRYVQHRILHLTQKYQGKGDQFRKDFKASFINNFPKLFFILLPVFALLLKLLYIRRDFYYSEHLVFSIYCYNFFFLAGSLSMLFNLVPWLEWVTVIIGLCIALYLLFGMKKMYNQSWIKTIIKYSLFVFVFMFCVGIGFLINLGITLMNI